MDSTITIDEIRQEEEKGKQMQTRRKKITKFLIMAVTTYGNKVIEVLGSKEEARKVLYEYQAFYVDDLTPYYIKQVSVA